MKSDGNLFVSVT